MLTHAYFTGGSAPEDPGRREGSEEGCTSQEHPNLPIRAAAGSRLSNPTPKEFAAFAGPQGIVDAAQMAQAASALQQSVQQSGLRPYFMHQAYAPQLARAQLQQVGIANCGLLCGNPSTGPVAWGAHCTCLDCRCCQGLTAACGCVVVPAARPYSFVRLAAAAALFTLEELF